MIKHLRSKYSETQLLICIWREVNLNTKMGKILNGGNLKLRVSTWDHLNWKLNMV